MRVKFLQKAGVLAAVSVLTFTSVPMMPVQAKTDAEVTNTAGYSTDVIYQIVTDRFLDGDSSNNPSGAVFDKGDMKKYHGGDWAGITQKINDGYFQNMGVTALWISSPVIQVIIAHLIMDIGVKISLEPIAHLALWMIFRHCWIQHMPMD